MWSSFLCYKWSVCFLDKVHTNDTPISTFHLVLSIQPLLCCLWFLLNAPAWLFHFLPSNEHLPNWACPFPSIHTGLSMLNSSPSSITPTFSPLRQAWKLHHQWHSYLSLHIVISQYDSGRLFFEKTQAAMPFSYSHTHPWFILADAIRKLKKNVAFSFSRIFPSWWAYKFFSLWKIFLAVSYFQNQYYWSTWILVMGKSSMANSPRSAQAP